VPRLPRSRPTLSVCTAQTLENPSSKRTTTPADDRPETRGDSASCDWTLPSLEARIVPIHTVGTRFGIDLAASAKSAESAGDQIHCPIAVSCETGGSQADVAAATNATMRFAANVLRE
jgi:hypothetical protein